MPCLTISEASLLVRAFWDWLHPRVANVTRSNKTNTLFRFFMGTLHLEFRLVAVPTQVMTGSCAKGTRDEDQRLGQA